MLSKLRLDGPLVAVGDAHFPFHNAGWLKWQLALIKDVQPAYVVQVGDLRDNYFASKYARTLNIMTPAAEINAATLYSQLFWEEVKRLAPKAQRIQIKGNHDARIDKRLFEKAPELEGLIDLETTLTFPGVKTIHDEAQELLVGDVVLQHGHTKFGEHARYNQASTICGHLHRGGVVYYMNRQGIFWEMNAGFGGDRNSRAFAYRSRRVLDGWTLGCGLVDDRGPRFAIYPGQ